MRISLRGENTLLEAQQTKQQQTEFTQNPSLQTNSVDNTGRKKKTPIGQHVERWVLLTCYSQLVTCMFCPIKLFN